MDKQHGTPGYEAVRLIFMGAESGSAGWGIHTISGSGRHDRGDNGRMLRNTVFMRRYFLVGALYAGRGRRGIYVFLR